MAITVKRIRLTANRSVCAVLTRWLNALCAAFLLASCEGRIGDPSPYATSPNETPSGQALQVVRDRFTRLSHAQWEQTIVDLFHLGAPTGLSGSFAPDPLGGKVFDNAQSALVANSGLLFDYHSPAARIPG